MSFIPNLILVLALLGILAIFFRRIPEVIDQKRNVKDSTSSAPVEPFNNKALLKTIWNSIKTFTVATSQKIWHFMLEAKDLKQSQIIAAKFSRLVAPKARLQNIGAFNNLKKAGELAEQGNVEEAEKLYIQVIRKHPQEFQAYEGLVKIYTEQKKYDDVVEILQFLIEHHPAHDGYYAQLGSTYLISRRFPESAEAYRRALSINSLVSARFINLGLALQGAGENEEALVVIQKGVDLDPANTQYLMIFVDSLVEMNQQDRALTYLRQAEESDPTNTAVRERITSLEGRFPL